MSGDEDTDISQAKRFAMMLPVSRLKFINDNPNHKNFSELFTLIEQKIPKGEEYSRVFSKPSDHS